MGLIRQSDFNRPQVNPDEASNEKSSVKQQDRSWAQAVVNNLNKNVMEENSEEGSKEVSKKDSK